MEDVLEFSGRTPFRTWLEEHCLRKTGVWLLFGKPGGPKTLTAHEALEEALCFGWIDGQMQSLDDRAYKKYFSQRRENSKWSEKNKALAEKLEKQGLMTVYGRRKMEQAKQNGQWYAPKTPPITPEQVAAVAEMLKGHAPAYTNFLAMAASVQRTYTRAYFDTKTEAGREKRLAWMMDRLDKNLKPM